MLNEVGGASHTQFTGMAQAPKMDGTPGKLIGKAVVQISTPQSIFQESLEELSFTVNKSDRFARKDRKERSQTDRSLKERLNEFRKVAESRETEQKHDLTTNIEKKPERESILSEAFKQHNDAAEAWAALEDARDSLAQKGADPRVLQEVDEALRLMDMRYGAAIRAGVCGTLTAAQDYVSLGAPLDLGATYRKAVLEITSTFDLYTMINTEYGGNFDMAVDFLYASLNADMACDSPSADSVALESLNTSIGKLRSFQSAESLCDKQMTRWKDVHNVQDCPMKGLDLLGKVLNMGKQTFLSASEVESVTRDAKATTIENKIVFLQELMQNVRSFSPLLFDAAEGRTRVIDAVQGAVDKAVAEEDAMLDKE